MIRWHKHFLLISLFFVSLLHSLPSLAVVETYQFSVPQNRERYHLLVDELRCPKCQNQNLSGSNSPIAKDLRRQIHRMVEAGENDKAIEAFMVKRYGNFVLYKPPIDINTLVLWLLPLLLLILSLSWVVFSRRRKKAEIQGELSESEQLILADILKRYS